ncbi:unnamed protein product [Musa textilis]
MKCSACHRAKPTFGRGSGMNCSLEGNPGERMSGSGRCCTFFPRRGEHISGEARAVVCCKEIKAYYMLSSDRIKMGTYTIFYSLYLLHANGRYKKKKKKKGNEFDIKSLAF